MTQIQGSHPHSSCFLGASCNLSCVLCTEGLWELKSRAGVRIQQAGLETSRLGFWYTVSAQERGSFSAIRGREAGSQ